MSAHLACSSSGEHVKNVTANRIQSWLSTWLWTTKQNTSEITLQVLSS